MAQLRNFSASPRARQRSEVDETKTIDEYKPSVTKRQRR
jgi:hypothetical protein